jgi:hypothetical protein
MTRNRIIAVLVTALLLLGVVTMSQAATSTPTHGPTTTKTSPTNPVPRVVQAISVERDLNVPYCETAATCGLSSGCDNHRCLPCTTSSTCLSTELCAKGRCLTAALVACTSNEDCGLNEFCHLDSETGKARGNEGVAAKCLSKNGGREIEEPTVYDDEPRKYPRDMRGDRLMEALQKQQEKGE